MRETIGRPPHWFVRYSTMIVALALLALGAAGKVRLENPTLFEKLFLRNKK